MRKKVDQALTPEQQKLVSDNHNLIYSYAKKMNLELDEYYGILAIGLCQAASLFDPDLGFAFSTLAYTSMRSECYSYWRNTYMCKHHLPKDLIVSLDAPIHEDPYSKEFYDKIYDIFEEDYKAEILKVEIKEFIETLSERDQILLLYLLQGYSRKEIAAYLGVTRSNIGDRLKKLKERWTMNRYRLK